jgi:hypothetical protein
MEHSKNLTSPEKIVNFTFLAILNITIISILGYMTLDSNANLNSRVGGILLSIFISIYIVNQTKSMKGMERMIKFGFGSIAYLITSIIIVGFVISFTTWLIPCLVISLGVLFYGEKLISIHNNNVV